MWGVVVEIDPAAKSILDSYEDFGTGYLEKSISVEMTSGAKLQALTYYAIKIDPQVKPFQWYLDLVIAGANEHGLPKFYLETIQGTISVKDPDQERDRRNRNVLNS